MGNIPTRCIVRAMPGSPTTHAEEVHRKKVPTRLVLATAEAYAELKVHA